MLSFLSVILIYSSPLNQLAQGPTAPSNSNQGQTQSSQSQPQGESQKKSKQLVPLFLDGGETIAVSSFNFSGNSQVPASELEQLVRPYLNQSIAQSDLGAIKGRIQSYYQSKGFPQPQIMIPTQENPSTLNIIIKESNN